MDQPKKKKMARCDDGNGCAFVWKKLKSTNTHTHIHTLSDIEKKNHMIIMKFDDDDELNQKKI